MLTAIELVGFKSFADRTRLEFPPGITAVVGPNGSGKSNVVDAIKWVLGEQSVKSLRGKEMSDVIFGGSKSRKPMNSAEITLTFDNTNGLFPLDTPEVHITRRIYRGGEGEYLLNRNPCRLRDIREMLFGTGMGSNAYSVIEQGKVDRLLQASPRERRTIIEEAAGISRFKAKKIETQRRLARVEQNLLRLSDIVEEVESRLRRIRSQAGRASRYKECNDRLRELRTQAAMVDWHRLSERLNSYREDFEAKTSERDEQLLRIDSLETDAAELENEISLHDERIHDMETLAGTTRERIADGEATIRHQRSRCNDLSEEISRQRQCLLDLSLRAGNLQQQMREATADVKTAQERHAEVAAKLTDIERQSADWAREIERLDQQRKDHRIRRTEVSKQHQTAENKISSLEKTIEAASAVEQEIASQIESLASDITETESNLKSLLAEQATLEAETRRHEEAVFATREEQDGLNRRMNSKKEELSEAQRRHSAMTERIAVLDRLQQGFEGIGAGVKEILLAARGEPTGPWRGVLGMLGDLFDVSVDVAPLVDIALGATAQYLVVRYDESTLRHIQAESNRLAGRVGFLWIQPQERPANRNEVSEILPFDKLARSENGNAIPPMIARAVAMPRKFDDIDFTGMPGVFGRADRHIETRKELVPLAYRLLGKTWIVETLEQAVRLANKAPNMSFVTFSGQYLTADGTLIVGPRESSAGVISRRSELRTLRVQISRLSEHITQLETEVAQLRESIEHQSSQVIKVNERFRESSESLAVHRSNVASQKERILRYESRKSDLENERTEAEQRREDINAELETLYENRSELQKEIDRIDELLERIGQESESYEQEHATLERQATEIKVELAKSEERMQNQESRVRQFEMAQQEREQAIEAARRQLSDFRSRMQDSERTILHTESRLAFLYLEKERLAVDTDRLFGDRETTRKQRDKHRTEAKKINNKLREIEEKISEMRLAVNQTENERTVLAARLREDYGLELAGLEHEPTEDELLEQEKVREEIDRLRQEIAELGHVNLEALEELEQTESRYDAMATQYHDLVEAKESLEKIIDKINVDSQRLFTETLETVRDHFQKLFCDMFGGGSGDIILEDSEDPLECGIEIVAKPPGKELRSISLLSGGEKTLTCVALLLALFRSRPSPFCLLDEVDAALDDANIGRFTAVLESFLSWTQFIIITHSKETMTSANTIYGVTMQESGISKPISVRFEDVSEDGHILTSGIDDDTADDGAKAA